MNTSPRGCTQLDLNGNRFVEVPGEALRDASTETLVSMLKDLPHSAAFDVRVFGMRGMRVLTPGDDERWIHEGVERAYEALNARSTLTPPIPGPLPRALTLRPALVELKASTARGTDHDYWLTFDVSRVEGHRGHLFQETRATLNPDSMHQFVRNALAERLPTLARPFRVALSIGGTSVESCLDVAARADARLLDHLPTGGGPDGLPFRAVEFEEEVLAIISELTDSDSCSQVRVIRSVRHGGSLPIGLFLGHPDDRRATVDVVDLPEPGPRGEIASTLPVTSTARKPHAAQPKEG